jgi:hypothetical protein
MEYVEFVDLFLPILLAGIVLQRLEEGLGHGASVKV